LNELKIDQNDFRDFLIIYYNINFKSNPESSNQNSTYPSNQVNFVIKALIDLRLEDLNARSYSFQIDLNSLLTIITLKKESFAREPFIYSVYNILSKNSDLYIICSISNIYHNINKLKAAYDDAFSLFSFHTLKEENQFLVNESVKSIIEYILLNKLSNKISSIIELSLFDKLESSLLEALDYFEMQNIPIYYIKRNFIGIFNDLINSMRKKPIANLETLKDIYNNIDLCSTREDFRNLLISMCNFICMVCRPGNDASTGNQTVDRIISYIQENYQKDIYLDLLADIFKMSPIYLSKIFKDYSGINFSDFLNQFRLKKARDFLKQSDIKVKDLSAQIGFKNVNTFIKAFKKNFGISPGEYRKSIGYNDIA
jgi:two-component system response regulator YesN